MNRAKRRHHRFRIREKAKRVHKWLMEESYDGDFAIRCAEHLATCSCSMCGNPRKYLGETTRQEAVDSDPNQLMDEA